MQSKKLDDNPTWRCKFKCSFRIRILFFTRLGRETFSLDLQTIPGVKQLEKQVLE